MTMRTPGHDFELAAGFLHSEGLLSSPLELREIKYCTDVELGEQAYNVVTVHLRRAFEAALGKIGVDPTREEVLVVPLATTMPQQDERRRHF